MFRLIKGISCAGVHVINLSYLWNAGEELNLTCTHNLLAACKDAKVSRLIHCSTAAVAGRASKDLIDEKTQCLPISEYGTTKLKIELASSILRRIALMWSFCGRHRFLESMVSRLKNWQMTSAAGNYWKNYLKSCLFGRRRMNLVPVANVVAAIIFVSRYAERFGGEIFIVSDDDDPQNNFIDVERFLMGALGVKEYRLPRLPIPMACSNFCLCHWAGIMSIRSVISTRANCVN